MAEVLDPPLPALRTIAIVRKGTGDVLSAVEVSAAYTDEELIASLAPYGFTIDTEVFDSESGAHPAIDATIRTYVDLEIWLSTAITTG